MTWLDTNAAVCYLTLVKTVRPCWPHAAQNPVKMEVFAESPKTMRASPACVRKDGKARHARSTSTNVSKTLAEMAPPVRTPLAATNAAASQATRAAIARQTSMTANPIPAVTEDFAKMPLMRSPAPACLVSAATDARRTSTNARATHVKTAQIAPTV